MGESTILLFQWIVCFRSSGTIVVHHRRLRLNQFSNIQKKSVEEKVHKGSSQTHLILILHGSGTLCGAQYLAPKIDPQRRAQVRNFRQG